MKNIIQSNRESGFTLIELMVALVLTIFLAGGAILMHLSGRQASVDAERISRMQENIRFASDYMIRDIRNAGFRDETFLRIGHESQIKQAYANIGDSDGDGIDELRIRYAGRGHCTESFNEFRLVENVYYLEGDKLSCNGSFVARDDLGSVAITPPVASNDSGGVGLVSGVTGLAFEKICPDGTTTCECNLNDYFDTSCIGVRISIELEGSYSVDDSTVRDDRRLELVAAFRNIILDRNRYLTVTLE